VAGPEEGQQCGVVGHCWVKLHLHGLCVVGDVTIGCIICGPPCK
jgi:hypothetical protein